MRRRLYFKPGLQEQIRQNQKAVDHYAKLSGRPSLDLGAKEKRERGPVNVDASEAPVQKAVNQLLARDPRVAIAIRINRGLAHTASGGVVKFNRMTKGDGVLVDNIGTMKDARPFAIECKKPDWRGPSGGESDTAIRERDQLAYILHVRSIGGLSGFARSADEAKAILDGRPNLRIEVIRGSEA